MASTNLDQSPVRVPSPSPARLPARETSWQGKPPLRMSTGGTLAQSILVMSPRFGAWGNRCARTLEGPSSNSETHWSSAPKAASTAIPRPP